MQSSLQLKRNSVSTQSLWRALGLKVFPFSMHTEYRGYALPQIWFRLLRSLQAFLRKDQLLAIFYGPAGIGKRSLLLQWLRFGRVKMPQCHIIGRADMQPLQLIQKIAESFELSLHVPNSVFSAIENFERAAESFVGVRLLVIDCVEKFPLATVAVVAKLISDQSKNNNLNLKTIVTLDSSRSLVHDLFADSASAQEILRLNMQRYSLDDTREYILHRLRASGLPGGRILNEAVVQKIHADSAGIPGSINEIAAKYSPKSLLEPLAVVENNPDGWTTKFRRFFSFYNIGAYSVGLLMSLSIALLVMSRPSISVGSGVVNNGLHSSVRTVADVGMSGVHTNYDFFDTEKFLKHGPTGRYALLLASFPSTKHARQFVWRTKLSGYSYYWLHKHNGKHWTAVLLGSFTTRKQAQQALLALPHSLERLRPKVQVLPKKQNI